RFRRRFDLDPRDHFRSEVAELVDLGLLEVDDERLRLSPRGYLLGNQVFARFLPL
ncbi:MAG: hypothetical protein ACK2UY_11785, partial [Anaerolineae bacterium]